MAALEEPRERPVRAVRSRRSGRAAGTYAAVEEVLMSNLVAIAYPDQQKAEEAIGLVARLQKEGLLEIDDAAYVTKDQTGKLKLHQANSLVGAGAATGALWGMLFGLLFFVPFLGLAVGAATGALAGKFTDIGIDDKFMKDLMDKLQPGTSAVFVLVRRSTIDKVLPEVAKLGGTVLHTSLSKDAEELLEQALAGGSVA
jgi:uncharacterized membrane protein